MYLILIHKGHIEYFKEAKKFGEILVASVTADKHVNKGVNRPYFNSLDRIKFLTELELIDFVILVTNKSSVEIINSLKPNFTLKDLIILKRKMIKRGKS